MPKYTDRPIDNDEDQQAYTEISNRKPLEDLSAEGRAQDVFEGKPAQGPPHLADTIQKSLANRQPSMQSLQQDPLIADHEAQQQKVKEFLIAQNKANTQQNILQALSRAERGGQAPIKDNLYETMQKQNRDLASVIEAQPVQRQKVLEAIESRKSRQEASEQADQTRRDIAHERDMDRRAIRGQSEDQKTQGKQDSLFKDTSSLLESARGTPAIAQAEKDLYAASKADSLAKLYGDPNKLSTQMVKLLASEVAKIAAGGAPTMHELEGLTPGTLATRFSEIASKLTNKPTAANAGQFVKQYQDYGRALTKDAQKIIKDRYGRILESRKGSLRPEHNQALADQYLHRFDQQDNEPAGASHAGKIVEHGGKMYKVGEDGNTLIEVKP